jgi:hypothetical protein
MLVPCTGVIIHFIGIFSFFYLLSEGRCTTFILLAVTVLLTAVQTLSYVDTTTRRTTKKKGLYRSSRSSPQIKLTVLGFLATACISLSSYLGLLGHSGYGFWQRLTVHEPREADSSLVNEEKQGQNSSFSMKSVFALVSGGFSPANSSSLVKLIGPEAILVGKYLINYGIPSILLHQLILAQLKKSRNEGSFKSGGSRRLQRVFISMSFFLLGVHDVLEQHNIVKIRDIPLNLLLPRFVLLTGCASLLFAVFNTALSGAARQHPKKNFNYYLFYIIASIGSILPIMLLISSTVTPFIALLCAVESMALTALIAAQSTNLVCAATTTAAVFSLLQTHVFFVTGHLPEFAGVQYTAGFMGYEEFHLVRSAALVILDTFGGVVLVGMGLVLAAAVLDASPSLLSSGDLKERNGSNLSKKTTRAKKTALNTENSASKSSKQGSLRLLLLLFGLNRAVAAFCATLSAGIQRRHLYAWSLFAPRFVFEVLFLASTDMLLLVLGWWIGC